MTTPHTPPTQAELNEWKRLHAKRADSVEDRRLFDNHAVAYFTDLIREIERLTKEVDELRKDKETSDLLIKGLEGNLAACEQENEKLRGLINPFDVSTAMQQKGGE